MRIAIFGTVGAGKTTLIKTLNEMLNNEYEVFWEPITNNPYFEDSYSPDLKISQAAAYKNEIFMLSARYKQFKESLNFKNVIYDRGIMDTIVFANCNYDMGRINKIDWDVFSEYFEICVTQSIISKNNKDGYDLVVYLNVDSKTSIKRIKNRGIKRELDVDHSFWELLVDKYNYWYDRLKDNMPFMVVDGNIEDPKAYAKLIINKIEELKKNKK